MIKDGTGHCGEALGCQGPWASVVRARPQREQRRQQLVGVTGELLQTLGDRRWYGTIKAKLGVGVRDGTEARGQVCNFWAKLRGQTS